MPRKPRLDQMSLGGKIFLGVLATVYVGYLFAFVNFQHLSVSTPSITEHLEDANLGLWTAEKMHNAIDADQQESNSSNLTQGSIDTSKSKAAQRQGQLPRSADTPYPLSTVGKVFFTSAAGQDSVCSGTAIVSRNQSVVDTAGHCLYWNGGWVQNLIFCPLYDKGFGRYNCWAARDLEVPSDWINRKPDDLHHDFGMVIVSPNSYGALTDVVGGIGWAYNQPANQSFSAYGYPAASPFDGQTIQSCKNRPGKTWQEWGGTVVSIPCNMTGGSSGGPWFIQIDGDLYLNGHNDFTTNMQRGHMFSPYYDDTWRALYDKAQYT